MTTAKVSSKGCVVIPAKDRKDLGITPGSTVTITRNGNGLLVSPVPSDPIAASFGMLKCKESLTEYLVKEHRKEVARDEKRLRQWK